MVIFFFILGISSARGQDPHFSQFYANPLYLNPAFAGVKQCPKVNVNYRNQYPTLGVYQTYSVSFDQFVDALNGGVGVLIVQDEAANGALSLTEASLIYSYHLAVSRKFSILFGAQGTFRQRASRLVQIERQQYVAAHPVQRLDNNRAYSRCNIRLSPPCRRDGGKRNQCGGTRVLHRATAGALLLALCGLRSEDFHSKEPT